MEESGCRDTCQCAFYYSGAMSNFLAIFYREFFLVND